jgi:ABC-type transporter Mla MlaB component
MATSPPRTVALTIRGPLLRGDLPGLYARTCALLRAGSPEVIRCDVAGLAANAIAADALARLALLARRQGCRTHLCGASRELLALVALVGLTDTLLG